MTRSYTCERLAILASALAIASGVPSPASSCTGTISSLSDISTATACSTVNINGFTVPAGQGFTLSLLSGTTVNLNGNILFGNQSWAGPLFTISGTNITFNGNGFKFDGGGPFYWDGQGTNGGTTKPHPMMKIKISGVWNDVQVVNSPAQTYSVSNPGPLVISNLNIDNSQGNFPNSQSGGLSAGHNTDGFDCSTTDLTIEKSVIQNQDDCIAINKGSNIVFTGNTCIGGHGISIGSVQSNSVVTGILISQNTIVNNQQAFRIKTVATATNASVSNITYTGNTGTGAGQFGVLIDQSYPATLGVPGNGVQISDINFSEEPTTISVNATASQIAVNCGVGSCTGKWNWSELQTRGTDGPINNFTGIVGYSQ